MAINGRKAAPQAAGQSRWLTNWLTAGDFPPPFPTFPAQKPILTHSVHAALSSRSTNQA